MEGTTISSADRNALPRINGDIPLKEVCPLDLTVALTQLMGGGETPHPPQAVPLLLAQTLPSVSASADISPLSGEYLKGKV